MFLYVGILPRNWKMVVDKKEVIEEKSAALDSMPLYNANNNVNH